MPGEAGRFGQILRTAVLAGAVGGTWSVARAQGEQPEPAPPEEAMSSPQKPPEEQTAAEVIASQETRPVRYLIRGGALFQFNTGFDGSQPGDVTINRAFLGMLATIPTSQQGEMRLGIDYMYSRYEFNNATGILPGTDTPWEQMHNIKLYAGYGYQFNERWGTFFLGNIGVAFEEGAGVDDSILGGGIWAMTYTFSPKLTIGLGLGAQTQIEDGPIIFPVFTIDWRITDEWRVSNERLVLQNRPGIALTYSPVDEWSFSLAGWYDRFNYRLNDNGPLPHGALVDSSVPIMFVVGWDPTPKLSLEVGAGAIFSETFDLINQQSNQVAEVHVDVPLAAILNVRFRF